MGMTGLYLHSSARWDRTHGRGHLNCFTSNLDCESMNFVGIIEDAIFVG